MADKADAEQAGIVTVTAADLVIDGIILWFFLLYLLSMKVALQVFSKETMWMVLRHQASVLSLGGPSVMVDNSSPCIASLVLLERR